MYACLHHDFCGSGDSTSLGTRCHSGHVVLLEGDVMSGRLLRIGVVGSVLTAICCFTPVLVVLLGAIGLSAIIAYLDVVLIPALAIFLGLTGHALWTRSKTG